MHAFIQRICILSKYKILSFTLITIIAIGVTFTVQAEDQGPWDAYDTSFDMRESVKTAISDLAPSLNPDVGSGSARLSVTVFSYPTESKNKDYYRVDISYSSSTSQMNGCGFGNESCGFYISAMDLKAEIKNDGKLLEHMPKTLVNVETGSYTIGGNISAAKTGPSAGLSAGYSRNYTVKDVNITDNTNDTLEVLDWTVRFKKPNYFLWPEVKKPAEVSMSSYTWKPSFTMVTPKGVPPKICFIPYLEHRLDLIPTGFGHANIGPGSQPLPKEYSKFKQWPYRLTDIDDPKKRAIIPICHTFKGEI